MGGDTGCHTGQGGVGTIGILWVEARDAAKYPVMQGRPLTTKSNPIQVSIVLRLRNLAIEEGVQRLREI